MGGCAELSLCSRLIQKNGPRPQVAKHGARDVQQSLPYVLASRYFPGVFGVQRKWPFPESNPCPSSSVWTILTTLGSSSPRVEMLELNLGPCAYKPGPSHGEVVTPAVLGLSHSCSHALLWPLWTIVLSTELDLFWSLLEGMEMAFPRRHWLIGICCCLAGRLRLSTPSFEAV